MRITLALMASLTLPSAALANPLQPHPLDPPQRTLADRPDYAPARCDEDGLRRASGAPARPQRLTELPRADMHLLVVRRVDGCSVPTIVVRDVEANRTQRRR